MGVVPENGHDKASWIAIRTRIELTEIVSYAESSGGFRQTDACNNTP